MAAGRRGRLGIQAYLALVGTLTALPVSCALSILLLRDLHQLRATDVTRWQAEATLLADAVRCRIDSSAMALLLDAPGRGSHPQYEVRLSGVPNPRKDPILLVSLRTASGEGQMTTPLQRAVHLGDLLRTDTHAQSAPALYLLDPAGAAWPLDGSPASRRPASADWLTRPIGSGWQLALPRKSAALAAEEKTVMREFGIGAVVVLFSQLAMLYFVAVHLRAQLAKVVNVDKTGDPESVISEFAEVRGALSAARQTAGRAARELERAKHDALTGLPARELFLARAAGQAHFARKLHGYGIAVLFIDLDGFKAINDALGHAAGDEALKRVGAKLRDCVRPPDTVARYGGDEFVVCLAAPLQGLDDLAASAAMRIKEAVRDVPPGLGCSIGWSVAAPDCDLGELIARADAAMYAEKRKLRASRARESLALF